MCMYVRVGLGMYLDRSVRSREILLFVFFMSFIYMCWVLFTAHMK